jgi:hypothetical protein
MMAKSCKYDIAARQSSKVFKARYPIPRKPSRPHKRLPLTKFRDASIRAEDAALNTNPLQSG